MANDYFGRYEILANIGLGGMARVYQAHDPQMQREVAIKVLPPEYLNDLGFRARFAREAELIATLEHEAIVPVYEVGELFGQPFIVMRFMPNGSLASRLAHGTITTDEVAVILERLCGALDYAHRQGVIHQDLKPSNILFDQDGKAYLADFGLALQARSTWQQYPTISGTPAYMSPEQALRGEIDPRTDLYSLGIIVFEMLTGKLPFEGETPLAVVLKQAYDPPPRPGTIKADIPPLLEPVVLRALSKDAQERYQTAGEYLEAFRQALGLVPSEPSGLGASGAEASGASGDNGKEHPATEQPEISQPAAAHRTVPPQIIWAGGRKRSRPRTSHIGWARYIIAMGLVTLLGVFLATGTAVLAMSVETGAKVKVQMVYDEAGVAVINQSNLPMELTNLAFQRISATGEVTASFPGARWMQPGLTTDRELQPGACTLLLSPGNASLKIKPGETPEKPAGCKIVQGWLVAIHPDLQFWTAQADSDQFQVIFEGQNIHTCEIVEQSCEFYLPRPRK